MPTLIHIILNILLVVPILCFIVAFILILYTKKSNLANIFSAISAVLAGFYSFYMLSIAIGYIQYYPWLFGWAVPIEYLMSPSIYLFIRLYLYNNNKVTKYDLLFLVPMFIQFAEMSSFLFSDNTVKMEAYKTLMSGNTYVIKDGNTIFPPELHLVIKFLEHVCLIILLWYKIIQFDKSLKKIDFYKHPSMKQWIVMNTIILVILCVAPIILVLLLNGFAEFITYYSIILPVSVFFMVCSFLFKPWVLYDLPTYYSIHETALEENASETYISILPDKTPEHILQPSAYEVLTASDKALEESSTFTIDESTLDEYEILVDHILKSKRPYLQHGYTAGELAKDCNIPKHHLSYLLNRRLNIRYNDFINKYRIEFAMMFMLEEHAQQLTIDAIAVKSGFTSRTTFIKYFVKYTDMYPSDYLKKKHKEVILKHA